MSRKLDDVLIEIGVVHASTGWKWDRKIDRDESKLATIEAIQALQVVLVISPERDPRVLLEELRRRMTRFSRDPAFKECLPLGNGGQVAHLFAFTKHDQR